MSRRGVLCAGASFASVAAGVACYLAWRRRRLASRAERDAVLRFWFGGVGALDVDLYSTRWFVADGTAAQAALDAEVRGRFGALLERAECGALDDWRRSARGTLALIVVLDQLSRHAHRASQRRERVEANDALALRLSESLLAAGWEAAADEVVQWVDGQELARSSPHAARG